MLETELAQYLDGKDVLDFSDSGGANNTYLNYLPSEPDEAIGIYGTGGPWPSPKFIEQEGDVQFITRCGKDSAKPASDTAEDIFDELQGLSKLNLVTDGYYVISIQAKQARPVHIGRDENGRHKYSINFRVRYERPSTHRG